MLARNATSGWTPIVDQRWRVEREQCGPLRRRQPETAGIGCSIGEILRARRCSSCASPCRAVVSSTSSGLIDGIMRIGVVGGAANHPSEA